MRSKRYQVLDLFQPTIEGEAAEWVSVEDRLPSVAGKGAKVRIKCGENFQDVFYFWADKNPLAGCLPNDSSWFDHAGNQVGDVTHWKPNDWAK